jgi:hypothetical protein
LQVDDSELNYQLSIFFAIRSVSAKLVKYYTLLIVIITIVIIFVVVLLGIEGNVITHVL